MSSSTKLLTAGGFLSFFVFGFTDNLKGPLLPEMLRSGEFSYSQCGTIVFAGYIGFIVATLASGVLADRVSNRSVLLLAALCLCVGGLGFGATNSHLGLILFMSVSGLGLGAIELGGNGLMIELHSEARGRYLNLLSTFHGCGALLAPLYVAWLIDAGRNWQVVYATSILLAIPLFLIMCPYGRRQFAIPVTAIEPIRGDLSSDPLSGAQSLTDSQAKPSLWRVGFTKPMLCFYVLIAAYVAIEMSMSAWLMEFLQQERAMSVNSSSFYLSSFFLLLMLGRFLGRLSSIDSLPYESWRWPSRAARRACSLAFSAILAWLHCSHYRPFFCRSSSLRTVTGAVTRLHRHQTGKILGFLFACGGAGGAIGPWSVGLISDAFGLQAGLSVALGYAMIALLALLGLKLLQQ